MANRPELKNAAKIARQGQLTVFNAGRQHSDQLAAGLVEAKLETMFLHGAPIRASLKQILRDSHRFWPAGRALARSSEYVLPFAKANEVADLTYQYFDARAARHIRRYRPSGVIGYETASLQAFRAAKALGIPTILDAADVHFSMQDEEKTPFRIKVNARKTAEIGLADHILTCSTLARDSYVAAGVAPDRIHSIPLGVDLHEFRALGSSPAHGPLRVAFAGRFSRKKGADLLAGALDALATAGVPFECRIAADTANAEPSYIDLLSQNAKLLGKLAPDALPALYHWADVLIVPSRFDSFGLVVLEALSCGLPVIASDKVGARDYITPGIDGVIFPLDQPERLAELLIEHGRNPHLLRHMRPAASAAAAHAGWPDYRRRIAHKVLELLAK